MLRYQSFSSKLAAVEDTSWSLLLSFDPRCSFLTPKPGNRVFKSQLVEVFLLGLTILSAGSELSHFNFSWVLSQSYSGDSPPQQAPGNQVSNLCI